MENKLMSFNGVKVGQQFLIDNPLLGEDLVVCVSVIDSHKYSITSNDRKLRMIEDKTTGRTKPQYADESGDNGDEMIKEYCFASSKMGDYTFDECDDPCWNIRQIDETHPKYDKSLTSYANQFDSMLNMFAKMF